jgi:peptidoglycan/LPS O-acetylase OafA/YrhL
MTMDRIPSLDGIRAVSFALVFAAHTSLSKVLPGDLGVTIFFFLSGFLITTLMRAEFETNGSVNVRHFWLRRALRILPPLYTVIVAAIVLTLLLYPPGTMGAPAMFAEVFFYANYWSIYGISNEAPGTAVVWSLAVEEHFYLLFPLLYVAMQKWGLARRRQALLLGGLCALVLAWRFFLVIVMHADSTRIYLATDTRADSILFGCALALWSNPALDKSRLPENIWKFALLPVAVGALCVCALQPYGTLSKNTWCYSVQGAALTLVFVAAIRFYRWPIFRPLNCRPAVFIGALSYSLYLVHAILLRAVAVLIPSWPGWQRGVLALIASFIAAWAIHELIEKPCGRLRKRFAPVQTRTLL